MKQIGPDVHVCDTIFWRWDSSSGTSRKGNCTANKKLIKQLEKIYQLMTKIEGFEASLLLKKLSKET